MVPLTMLWLPILVSAVIVFIASNILWMALPFWHNRDYKKTGDDEAFMNLTANLPSGQYLFPFLDYKTLTAEQRAELSKRPGGYLLLRNPNNFSFPAAIAIWFLYILFVSFFVAYLTGRTLGPGTHYLEVFRVAGTIGVAAWALGMNFSSSIWYGKPWIVTIKEIIDGVIYGVLIAGTFGWLWPN